jgi:hypothetical protein
MVKSDWDNSWLKSKHLLPFDDGAYEECINKLATVIGKTLSKIQIPIISFVDAKEHTTHGHMLDVVEKNNPSIKISRYFKKEQARTLPYEYIKNTINSQLEQNQLKTKLRV